MAVIALDLLYLEPRATGGMEVYARNLVPLLPEAMPEARFVALAGRELAREWRDTPLHPAIDLVEVPASAASRIVRTGAELTVVEGLIHRGRVDLVHGFGNVMPLGPGLRRTVTIHDCIHFTHPETTSRVLAMGMRALIRAAVRRADRIITVSDSTASDLRGLLGVPADKIDVIHSGPGVPVARTPTPEGELRHRLRIPAGHIVLAVSARRPHKNLERLIRAVAAVPDCILVLPGYPTDYDRGLRAIAEDLGIAERVVFCGWVDDADLEGLYAAATCVTVPSLVEGFGLPVLEAMRRGVPVIASDIPVLREVGGDMAVFVDPCNVPDIADAIRRVSEDGQLHGALATGGRLRAQEFSWKACADATAASYRRTLSGR